MNSALPSRVTILGAGITGLTLAHKLTTLSPATRVTVVETSERVGGWMKTSSLAAVMPDGGSTSFGELAIEEGPRSVRPKGSIGAPRLLGLVRDLSLAPSLLTVPTSHPSASNRFVLWPGHSLQKLPSSPLSLLFSSSPLFLPLIGSILKEPFQPRAPASTLGDESVDAFIRRRFGVHVADNLLSAMVHGIYAADSRTLSVRSTFPFLWEAEQRRGSIVKALFFGLGKKTVEEEARKVAEDAAWDALGSFGGSMKKGISVWGLKGGLGTLGTKLREVLERERGVEFLLDQRVRALEQDAKSGIKITTSTTSFSSPLVISTLSSAILSSILPPSHGIPHLTHNPSATVSVVTLVFPAPPRDAPSYHPEGFGYLIPRTNMANEHGVLGVVFDSSAMGAVDGSKTQSQVVKFTLMIGGPHYNPPSSLRPPPVPVEAEALVDIALEHLHSTLPDLPKDLSPIATYAKTHVDCIPTYAPGHGARMRELHEALVEGPWAGKLAVAGASYGGVSLNDCVDSGMSLAERLVTASASGAVVTGLERWSEWTPRTIKKGSVAVSSLAPPRLSRTMSSLAPLIQSPRCGGILATQRHRWISAPRSTALGTRPISSSPRTRAGFFSIQPRPSSTPPQKAHVILRFIWKGLVVWFLLSLLHFGFVLWTNRTYVIQTMFSRMRGSDVKEYQAPEGSRLVSLDDIKGAEEAKEDLREFVEFLKDPAKFSVLGGRPHKGVLLAGPPGTGKTMLARAVAQEAGVPFFYASGSEFEDTYVGVGAQRVRQLFAVAKSRAPAIVFIDELDSVGSKRDDKEQGVDLTAGGASKRQTLNQLLTELDGFSADADVVVMAATNFPESLDAALTRPGRFDRHVNVPLPDVQGRLAILKLYAEGIVSAPGLDLETVARGTPGLAGADLENLINQAAVKASKEGDSAVRLHHLEWARDRALMGSERKSRYIPPKTLETSAYVEAGRALIALQTPGAVPLHKVSIMPRGNMLSSTIQLSGVDQDSISYKEYLARIDVAMSGRVAEELVFGRDHVSDRTQDGLANASGIANAMVKSLGFSDRVGLVAIDRNEAPFLSKSKKNEIESEVKRLVESSAERARSILQKERPNLERLANALLEWETLSVDEVQMVLRGDKVVRKPPPTPPQPSSTPLPCDKVFLPIDTVTPGVGGAGEELSSGTEKKKPRFY